MKNSSKLVVGGNAVDASGVLLDVQPEAFGFEYLSLRVRRLAPGESYSAKTDTKELGIVILGGRLDVESDAGVWRGIGGRSGVFSGLPWTVYLPIHTAFSVTAVSHCDVAFCYSEAKTAHAAALIKPDDVRIEVRGGANATRQINHILTPEFAADRLLIVEVYTPSGNWSSYPPHKHDVHNPPQEVDLEEFYYYRIDRPEGYAMQRVYTKDGRIDEALTVRTGDLVLIPEGYHPVVAAHGYNVYYLNLLAGSARSMAASDDPDYGWVRKSWQEQDPRVPVVK